MLSVLDQIAAGKDPGRLKRYATALTLLSEVNADLSGMLKDAAREMDTHGEREAKLAERERTVAERENAVKDLAEREEQLRAEKADMGRREREVGQQWRRIKAVLDEVEE